MKRTIAAIAAAFCGLAMAQSNEPEATAPTPADEQEAGASTNSFPAPPVVVSGVPVSGPERAIAQEIADTMNKGDGFRDASITVTSRKGEVLLEGSAPSKAQAEQAGVIAAQVAGGDVQVTNQVVGWS